MTFFIGIFFGIASLILIFEMNRLFGLPIPILTKNKYHIHHSFYGLIFGVLGLITKDMFLLGIGIGFIIHHEYTEPGLKGFNKFISVQKKHGRK